MNMSKGGDTVKNIDAYVDVDAEDDESDEDDGRLLQDDNDVQECDEDDEFFTTYISASSSPSFVDLATKRCYYHDFQVKRYGVHVCDIKLGDTIAVHVREDDMDMGAASKAISKPTAFACQALNDAERIKSGIWYPFGSCWSPCEVITIWKTESLIDAHYWKDKLQAVENEAHSLSSKSHEGGMNKRIRLNPASLDSNRSTSKKSTKEVDEEEEDDEVMIEVRWLFRDYELQSKDVPIKDYNMFASIRTSEVHRRMEIDEIFESDQVDEITSLSFLGTVTLFSDPFISYDIAQKFIETAANSKVKSVPLQCRQFWSSAQRSLLACGPLDKRIERGRLYSRILEKNIEYKRNLKTYLGLSKIGPKHDVTLTSPKDLLSQAAEFFSLAATCSDAKQNKLCGREKELERISNFVREAICSTAGESSLFVAGPPGTGKTASVSAVIAQLQKERAKGDLKDFEFVSVNGMEMRHPTDAYVKLWDAISEEKRPPNIAAKMLEQYFGDKKALTEITKDKVVMYRESSLRKKRRLIVLLVDELDYLVTKKQEVLYNIFDWPTRKSRGMVVIGISNTINLAENILLQKVQSRLGGARVIFQAYNTDQVLRILQNRLSYVSDKLVFRKDALQFTAMKTAALNGDIRKAFQICKCAAESVLDEVEANTRTISSAVVTVQDIRLSIKRMQESPHLKAVSTCTSFEALIIISLASLRRQNGTGSSSITNLIQKMKGIASVSGNENYYPLPSFGETVDLLNRMFESRLVTIDTPKTNSTKSIFAGNTMGMMWPLVTVNLDDQEIYNSLKNSPNSEICAKHLPILNDYF